MSEPKVPDPQLVRFAAFELDLRAGELRKGGARIKLEGQPVQILAVLVERPGLLVTREELKQRLWPGDTFVDFEHSINAAMTRLRQALDDSAETPRFIETLHRRGYRFIYPLNGAAAELPLAPTVAWWGRLWMVALLPAWKRLVFRSLAIAVPLAALAVVAAVFVVPSKPVRALTESDTILLADFVNTTGNPVFDDTLKKALAVHLSQSPYLHIFPEERARETLQQMQRSPDDRLTPRVVREVCQRQGIKAMLVGSIASLGSNYVITLEATNCDTGEALALEQVEAQGQEQVLTALGRATTSMRSKLGESLASVQKFDAPIDQATTPSLEAMKAYALGTKQQARENMREAIPFFQRAVELDPSFALAYSRMGLAYGSLGEYEQAKAHHTKAFDLKDRVSERERLYIMARYYMTVSGEVDKEIQAYEFLRQLYPREHSPWMMLAARYGQRGEFEKALEYAQRSVQLNPDHFLSRGKVALAYAALGRAEDAKAAARQAIAKFDNWEAHYLLYAIAYAEGDVAAMKKERDWARGKGLYEAWFLSAEAHVAASEGKMREARALFARASEGLRRLKLAEPAAVPLSAAAWNEAWLGNRTRALAGARDVLAMPHGSLTIRGAAMTLALAGAEKESRRIMNEMDRRWPSDTWIHSVDLPECEAILAMHRGDANQAIEFLEQTEPYASGWSFGDEMIYLRGLALLRAGKGAEAEHQFQRIIVDRRLTNANYLLKPLARLGLARAYALQGDTDRARAAYEDFLARWKDADHDVPILVEAKAEYARLGRHTRASASAKRTP